MLPLPTLMAERETPLSFLPRAGRAMSTTTRRSRQTPEADNGNYNAEQGAKWGVREGVSTSVRGHAGTLTTIQGIRNNILKESVASWLALQLQPQTASKAPS